jgi:hypothetical protein
LRVDPSPKSLYHRIFSLRVASLRPLLPIIAVSFFVLASPRPLRAEWVEWIADVEIGAEYYSNINRSSFQSDEREDSLYSASVSVGRYNQIADATRLRATFEASAGLHGSYDLLDFYKAGATLSIRQKIGFGADAPWLKPYISAAYMDVGDDARDSRLYEAGLRLGKRLTDRIDANIGYAFESRDGSSGSVKFAGYDDQVYDQETHAISAEASYILMDRVLLTGVYTYRNGDFDSSCTPANYTWVLARETVTALTADDAFTENYCVYRLEGSINSVSIDAGYSIFNGHGSVNIGYQVNDGKADFYDYQTSIVRGSFMYSY